MPVISVTTGSRAEPLPHGTHCIPATHVEVTPMSEVQLDPPKHSDELQVSFPAEHVILLTMNRPKALNSMSKQLENDIRITLNWFDDTPSLWCVRSPFHSTMLQAVFFVSFHSRVAIVTGEGKAFCAGADLKGCVYGLIVSFAIRAYLKQMEQRPTE